MNGIHQGIAGLCTRGNAKWNTTGAALLLGSLLLLHGVLLSASEPLNVTHVSSPTGHSEGEMFLAEPPVGWLNIYGYNSPTYRVSEFIPPDQDIGDAKDSLSLEAFPDHEFDPIEMLITEANRYQQACEFVQHFNVFSGLENGYPTSTRLILCGKYNEGDEGEASMFKAIKGKEHFYVITRSRRMQPFEQQQQVVPDIAQWSLYMRRIKLCQISDQQHACPQPEATGTD